MTALRVSSRARARRAQMFNELMAPEHGDRILDLGSEDGRHIAAIVPFRENVCIADIQPEALEHGRREYGFDTALISENGDLPFADDHFDIVFCSSALEHATIDKGELRSVTSRREFERRALERQRHLAREIDRISRAYFVQTPYRYFPVESHTWLPGLVVFLPRRALLRLLQATNRWWIKSTEPDWHLLSRRAMRGLFPQAEVVVERFAGVPKSLIAVKRPQREGATLVQERVTQRAA
jgi:SAM-dependent methyltransferase